MTHTKAPDANSRQVGGKHYQAVYQHWDLVADLRMGYFEGQITKYVVRWRKKNGVEDLRKARHFADKMFELMRAGRLAYVYNDRSYEYIRGKLEAFRVTNSIDVSSAEWVDVVLPLTYRCTYAVMRDTVIPAIDQLVAEAFSTTVDADAPNYTKDDPENRQHLDLPLPT